MQSSFNKFGKGGNPFCMSEKIILAGSDQRIHLGRNPSPVLPFSTSKLLIVFYCHFNFLKTCDGKFLEYILYYCQLLALSKILAVLSESSVQAPTNNSIFLNFTSGPFCRLHQFITENVKR